MAKFDKTQLFLFLSIIGPGIITATVDNDTGGITTYSLAGANFGYMLLWTLIPITFALILVQEMSARMGIVTGKGLSDLIRENFGIKVTFYGMLLLIFVNFGNVISEFAGIAASGEIFGISKYLLVPICAIAIWIVVVKGNYRTVEKIFLFATLFYASYVISGFMSHPPWEQVGLEVIKPHLSFQPNYLVMIIGLVGTTIAPWMMFYLQASIVEKGIKKENLLYSRIDVIIGSIVTSVVALFIIVATAATLYSSGVHIETAKDAALALKPFAGQYATWLFALGLFAAGIFSAAILPLSTSYSVCEGMGWESGINKKFREAPHFYVLITGLIGFGAGVILIPRIPLITVMYLSQVLNGILLPFVLIYMLKLSSNKKIMGKHVNGKLFSIVTWAVCILIILLTLLMVFTSMFPEILV